MKLLIVIIVLLLLSTVVEAAPSWSQNAVSVPSGSQYSPGKDYGFSINWTDATGISTVLFEWNGNNYTSLNFGDIFYYNLTGLAAGTSSYRWFANNTGGESASSDQFQYNVDKNSSSYLTLLLNGTEGNKSYSRYWAANFTTYLNLAGKNIFLDSNYSGINLNNDTSVIYYETNLTNEGFFIITASWNGDENYTASSKSFFFDTIPPRYYNLASSPLDYITYTPSINYSFNVSWYDANLSEVRFESNYTGSKKNYTRTTNPKIYNESNNFWFNLSDLTPRTFVYRWLAKDSSNNWTSTEQKVYRVFKAYGLMLYAPFQYVSEGTTTVFNCYSITDQLETNDFEFHRNSTIIQNSTESARADISVLDVGFYEYICETDGNENYTNQTMKANLTVVSADEEITPTVVKEFKISQISSPSINIGEGGQGTLNLSSTLDEVVTEISVEVVGLDTGIYTVENIPSALLTGGSTIIRINFNIPESFEAGTHNLTIKARGKSEGMTRIATGYMILKVNQVSPAQNIPPAFSDLTSETLDEETTFSFSLYDDRELSGFIFSINNTGEWVNDTWSSLDMAVADISISKNLGPITGLVAWKLYLNDSDNEWSVSEEYFLSTESGGFDFTLPILLVIAAVVAVAILLILKRGSGQAGEGVVYVYTREESK